jgi:hypothetical protein
MSSRARIGRAPFALSRAGPSREADDRPDDALGKEHHDGHEEDADDERP